MNRIPAAGLPKLPAILIAVVLATVALAGCKKREDTETTTMPPPADTTPRGATPAGPTSPATVTRVELGKAVDADKRVTTPTTTFAPRDTIHVSVATSTGNPNASVPATLGAKWTHLDSNQTVHEESRGMTLSGDGTTEFHISKPDGWPTGRYRVEVTLDGRVVQTRDFEVR